MYTHIPNVKTDLPIFPIAQGLFMNQTPILKPNGSIWHHVLWVNEGEMRITIDKLTYTLRKNEGIFFRKDVPVNYCSASNTELITSWVAFEGGEKLIDFSRIQRHLLFKCPEDMDLKAQILHNYIVPDNPYILKSAELYRWVAELFDCIAKRELSVSIKVKNYLNQNFFKQLTLDDIADAVGMNKYTLCRVYKSETDNHIMYDLKRIRCKKAAHLLVHTTMSVEEVGHVCGYPDASYFSKKFKSYIKCTPSEYRNKCANGEIIDKY